MPSMPQLQKQTLALSHLRFVISLGQATPALKSAFLPAGPACFPSPLFLVFLHWGPGPLAGAGVSFGQHAQSHRMGGMFVPMVCGAFVRMMVGLWIEEGVPGVVVLLDEPPMGGFEIGVLGEESG